MREVAVRTGSGKAGEDVVRGPHGLAPARERRLQIAVRSPVHRTHEVRVESRLA